MLVLKLKNDLLLLMKNFKIILFFLKQRVSKVFNKKIQMQKKIVLKHIVDIRTYRYAWTTYFINVSDVWWYFTVLLLIFIFLIIFFYTFLSFSSIFRNHKIIYGLQTFIIIICVKFHNINLFSKYKQKKTQLYMYCKIVMI